MERFGNHFRSVVYITCKVGNNSVVTGSKVANGFHISSVFIQCYGFTYTVNCYVNLQTSRTCDVNSNVFTEVYRLRSYCNIEVIILVCGYVEFGFNIFWIEDCTCFTRIGHVYGMFADNSQYISCCDEYATTSCYIGNLNTAKIDNRNFSTCLIRVDCYLDYSTLVVLRINHFNIKVIFEHFECCST